MKASFHTMFRRRERGNQTPEELFAVAAIAFCLRHDKTEFRRRFLTNICGLQLSGQTPEIEIEADTHKWGDLVIKDKRRSFVCVLEFKIKSSVKAHQNPNSRGFKYGKAIASDNPGDRIKRRFIVVTDEDKVEQIKPANRNRDGVLCAWKKWSDISPLPTGGGIVSDLFDCLGHLGLPTFYRRELKEMKLATSAERAGKLIEVLKEVGRHQRKKVRDFDTGIDNDQWWTGAWLFETDKQKKTWFGYEGGQQTSHPSVWFFCHNSESQRQKLKQLKQLKNICAVTRPRNEPNYLVANPSKKNRYGDLDWFLKVYGAVGFIRTEEKANRIY